MSAAQSIQVIQASSGTAPANDSWWVEPEELWLAESPWSVGDLVEIYHEGHHEVYEISGTWQQEEPEDPEVENEPVNEVRMGFDGRNRFYPPGTNAPSGFSATMETSQFSSSEYIGLRLSSGSWEEINDGYALRADSSALSRLGVSVGDRVEVTDENTGQTAIYRVWETASATSDAPAEIRMGANARDRVGQSTRSSSASGDFKPGDWDIRVEPASSDWEEVNDDLSFRASAGMYRFGWNGETFEDQDRFLLGYGGEEDYFGLYAEHDSEYAYPTIRMGFGSRQRIGISSGDHLDSLQPVPDDEPPLYLEQAVAGWSDIGDSFGVRLPEERFSPHELESFWDVYSEDTGEENTYGAGNFHDADFTLPTVRMSGLARERIGEPDTPSPVELTRNYERPDTVLLMGQSEWDEVGDEFAFRASEPLRRWYTLQDQETRMLLESHDTGLENGFGFWTEHNEEIWWPTIRMGANARERLGGPEAGTTLSQTVLDEPWPRQFTALSGWDEEVGNALLCRISQPLADWYGIEPGDYVEVTVRDHWSNPQEIVGESLIFQVNDIHDFQFDRMRSTLRTARWGRYRWTTLAAPVGEADVEDMEVKVEPYETELEHEYVGMSMAKGEWDYPVTSERVVIDQRLADAWGWRVKFDSPPEKDADRTYENANWPEGWENPRLYHGDRPGFRYNACTAYAKTDVDQDRRPRIYAGLFFRRKLAEAVIQDDGGYGGPDDEGLDEDEPEEDPDTPNSMVVQPRKTAVEPSITKPRTQHNRIVHNPDVEINSEGGEWYRNDESSRVLIFAPHGGAVEWTTSSLAYETAQHLNCAYWIFEGRRRDEGGSGFDRWHITSGDMMDGFPAIRSLGFDWDHALSYHGYTLDEVLVGGLASQGLRDTYAFDYLEPALPGEEIVSYGTNHEDRHEFFAAQGKLNITNRFTEGGALNGEGGIQTEFPSGPRLDDRWKDIAQATAKFYINEVGDIHSG